MNPYDFYIAPEEYQQAAANGIRAALLEVRIRTLAWSKERALSTPPHRKKRLGRDWIALAEQNGICYSTLRYRVNRLGWDKERAATQPLQDRKVQADIAREGCRKYPDEILELAKKNGINYTAFRKRITESGWDMMRAATTPTMTLREIGLYTKEKRAWKVPIRRMKAVGLCK